MDNKVIDEKYNAVVDAVCYWLGYQFKIGRDQLIHEASLRYPIADTLTAKGIEINRIVLEQLHPVFKSKKIDLVIFDKTVEKPEIEKDDSNLKDVFEFKIAKKETSDKSSDEYQRVFDDVVRLAYYNLWRGKDCYFLMCGKYENFKTFFVGQKSIVKSENNRNQAPIRRSSPTNELEEWKPDGLYKHWFGFKIGEIKLKEFSKLNNDAPEFESFQQSYHLRDKQSTVYSNSLSIRTTCLAITPNGLENIRTHAAGLWKIEAIDN